MYGKPHSQPIQGGVPAINPLGLEAQRKGNGDWLVKVMSGPSIHHKAADVTMQVSNISTGAIVIKCKVTALNATDGTFNDTDRDKLIDAGDTILLRDTENVDPGMKVQFLKGEEVFGTIKELPA